MRCKYSKIINLIRESVTESYFGKSFVAFKRKVEAGTPALEVAEDTLQRLGQGSTRAVFGFPDNPGIVLKIINWDDMKGINPDTGFNKLQMTDSNKWESDLQMQQKYPNVFPRTFEHADDFSWIISEKVKPVNSHDELFKLMGLGDEAFSKLPFVRNIQFQALIELGMSYFQEPGGAAQQMLRENDQTIVDTEYETPDVTRTMPIHKPGDDGSADPIETHRPIQTMARRLNKLVSNRQNGQILAAMGDLKIPPVEFSPKNIGISEITGKIVLLDASLWTEYKPVKEGRKMKITRRQLKKVIYEQLNVLPEAYEIGDGVNIPGVQGDGLIRASNGNYKLVHWQGRDVIAKLKQDNIVKKVQDLDYVLRGEIQDGWTKDTILTIQKRQPAKGVFTIETTLSIDSQDFTGKTSRGETGTSLTQNIDQWWSATADISATILDAIPPPLTLGLSQVAAAAITSSQTIKAVAKKDFLGAGLNIIALAPLAIGDSFKAAYPWVKKIATAAKSDATNITSAGVQLIQAMVESWDTYKREFKKTAQTINTAIDAKDKIDDAVIDNIYNAVNSAMNDLRKALPEKK